MSKKKKDKTRNVGSFALRINSAAVRDMFFRYLLLDLLLLAIVVGLWCYSAEMDFYGSINLEAARSFDAQYYKVVWGSGEVLSKDIGNLVYGVRFILCAMATLEGLFILKEIVFGTARIRKTLNPLNELAETADRLSNMVLDEDRFQNLQEAISKISPTVSNERIHIDDGELKGLEDSINKLLDRMRDSYRQQARFVSDASHELRTPISVIQGYANMLDRWGKEDEEVLEESIIAIKGEAENMKNLVEQLLFLARGINGKTQLKLEGFSLDDMMHEVLEESRMIDENHSYCYEGMENVKINGDPGLLKQTARILIENASKYTPEGGEIKLRSGITEKGERFFSVQDSGIGMDEGDVPHIFERFFRADTSRVRKNGGTGLGLSIAKWIIDNHHGYFGVLSRRDIGTRITVYLPAE